MKKRLEECSIGATLWRRCRCWCRKISGIAVTMDVRHAQCERPGCEKIVDLVDSDELFDDEPLAVAMGERLSEAS